MQIFCFLSFCSSYLLSHLLLYFTWLESYLGLCSFFTTNLANYSLHKIYVISSGRIDTWTHISYGLILVTLYVLPVCFCECFYHKLSMVLYLLLYSFIGTKKATTVKLDRVLIQMKMESYVFLHLSCHSHGLQCLVS